MLAAPPMPPKKSAGRDADPGDVPAPRPKTRTVKLAPDLGRMIRRAAALRDQNPRDYADPFLRAFAEELTRRQRFDAPPRDRPTTLDADALTTINAVPATANRLGQLAGFNRVSIHDLLNDPLFRDAVTADYLAALVAALRELGWEAARRKK